MDEQSHAEDLGVKVQGPLGVLDSEHDLLHHDLAHLLLRLHLGTVAVVGRRVELGSHAALTLDQTGFSRDSDKGLNGRGISPRAPVLLLARLDVCFCFVFVFKVELRHCGVCFIGTGL